MKKILITAIIILGAGVGYYFYFPQSEQQGFVLAASFDCKDGYSFMAEFPDENTVKITYNTGVRKKTGTETLTRSEGTEIKRFEDEGMIYTFAKEEAVILTKSDRSFTTCTQPLTPNNTPVNFGDADEGAGTNQDISKDIIGKWQSIDDAKFTRTFNADGTIIDSYTNTPDDKGTWKTFTKTTAPKDISFSPEQKMNYIRIIFPSKGEPLTLDLQVLEVTPESLQLIYMARGNMLNFRKVQ